MNENMRDDGICPINHETNYFANFIPCTLITLPPSRRVMMHSDLCVLHCSTALPAGCVCLSLCVHQFLSAHPQAHTHTHKHTLLSHWQKEASNISWWQIGMTWRCRQIALHSASRPFVYQPSAHLAPSQCAGNVSTYCWPWVFNGPFYLCLTSRDRTSMDFKVWQKSDNVANVSLCSDVSAQWPRVETKLYRPVSTIHPLLFTKGK